MLYTRWYLGMMGGEQQERGVFPALNFFFSLFTPLRQLVVLVVYLQFSFSLIAKGSMDYTIVFLICMSIITIQMSG